MRLKMTEADFTKTVIDIATTYGYLVSHFRPARTERGWRTPLQGDAGFPDLVIVGHGLLLLAELKVGRGKLRLEQERWKDAIQPEHYRLWYPKDIDQIVAELRTRPVTDLRTRRPST